MKLISSIQPLSRAKKIYKIKSQNICGHLQAFISSVVQLFWGLKHATCWPKFYSFAVLKMISPCLCVYLFIVNLLQINVFLSRMKIRERSSKSFTLIVSNWH